MPTRPLEASMVDHQADSLPTVHLPDELEPDALWSAFITQPDIGVALMDDDGTILYINEQMMRIFLDRTLSSPIGRKLGDFFPEEFLDLHRRHISFIAREQGPLAVRDVIRGRQIWSIIRPVRTPDGEPDRFLITSRELPGSDHEPPEGFESLPWTHGIVELGPLEALTPRELEVFVLMGQGLISKEIANTLRCSPRTVEVHKHSIAKKLKESDRIKLARLAFESGLSLRDAERIRSGSRHSSSSTA